MAADEFVFPSRWSDLRGRALDDERRRDELSRHLRVEVAEGHVLWGTSVTAVAACQHCDDVIFAIDGGRFAVVHLVWQGPQRAPWPDTDLLDGWDGVVTHVSVHEDQ